MLSKQAIDSSIVHVITVINIKLVRVSRKPSMRELLLGSNYGLPPNYGILSIDQNMFNLHARDHFRI